MTMKELCGLFNVSSRTLRYYEEIGLLCSTRTGKHTERRFTKDQVKRVNEILLMKSYGFCLDEIKDYLNEGIPLPELINQHKNGLMQEYQKQDVQIQQVESAITMLDENHSIYECDKDKSEEEEKQRKIAIDCLQHLAAGDPEFVYRHVSSKAQEILTPRLILGLWNGLVKTNGSFDKIIEVSYEQTSVIKIRYQTIGKCKEAEIGFGFHGQYIVSWIVDGGSIGWSIL